MTTNNYTVEMSVKEAKERMEKFYKGLPRLLELWSPIVGARGFLGLTDAVFDIRMQHFAYSLYYYMLKDVSPMLSMCAPYGDVIDPLSQFILDSMNDHMDVVVDDGTHTLLANYLLKYFLICRRCTRDSLEQSVENLLKDFEEKNENVKLGAFQRSPPSEEDNFL